MAAQPEASPDHLSATDTSCSVVYIYVLCQSSSCGKLLPAVICVHQCIFADVTKLVTLSYEVVYQKLGKDAECCFARNWVIQLSSLNVSGLFSSLELADATAAILVSCASSFLNACEPFM